jgi:serine/threonine protein kinase/tetratricopeptide (TPR) repeat protein
MAADAQRVQTLFLAAVEATDRADFLNQECGNDAELRRRVEALLLAHDQPGSFLEQHAGPAGPTADLPPPAPTEVVGSVVGPYKLLQKLGEGGMGTVFLAEQEQPVKRRVALKIIKAGLDSAHVLARFEAERQALALMDHPNIARVLDAGSVGQAFQPDDLPPGQAGKPDLQQGRPYFVMELVKGVPITKYCDQEHLAPQERLELFIPVCQAVQHAHQKGIIHRDIKPSNVLIALYDGKPIPKVIDFGVAKATAQKLTERTMFTEVGQMVGTLEYMAPEQAELNNLDIDTRADIYSLGVLLYELLTGSPPFTAKQLRSAAFTEMLRMIREVEPPRPSTKLSSSEELPAIAARRKLEPKKLTRLVHGELDWIVMKALEKDRNRRYETANGFALDIQRYLADEPVIACPPSAWYRFQKFSRRHKGPLVAAAVVFLALAFGMAGTTWGMFRAKDAQEREATAKDVALEEKAKAFAAAEAEKKAKLEAQEREAETKAVLDFVENKIIAAARPKEYEGGQGYDVKLADAVKAALSFVDKSFTGQPLIEARLRLTMGNSFWCLGDAKTAVEQHEAARQLYIQYRGPKHRDTLASMNDLANSYDAAGRAQDSLKLREETLQVRKAKLGPDNPYTLKSMNNLSNSYEAVGRAQEALNLRAETFQLRKAKLGPDHPETLQSMSSLAISYYGLGRAPEALRLYEQALKLQRAKLGLDNPDTLKTMHNLALSYQAVGRAQEALDLLEETFPLMKASLGPDHPQTLSSMHNLAISYSAVGRAQDALKLREETLHLRKAKLGPWHPDTLSSMHDLASSYDRAGRTDEALKLHEQTLPLRKAKLGPNHPDTLKSMGNLAMSYAAAGRPQEAVKLLEETLQLMKAKLGLDHPDTLISMHHLAISYYAAGRAQDALKLFEETLQLRRARLGPDHLDTLSSMNNLAAFYITSQQAGKAAAILQEALALRQRRVKAQPANSLEQANLARTHGQIGEAEQARLAYTAAVQAYARSVEIFDKLNKDGTLKDAYFRRGMSFYRQRLALCRKAEQAVQSLDFVLKQPAAEVPQLLDMRLRYLLKEQKLPAAVESAAKMKELAGDKAAGLYDAACAYALCAGAKNPAADAGRLAKECADQSLALLKQAVAKGFNNAVHMRQDTDLDSLRQRAEFQKLLKGLEKKAGAAR